MGWSGRAPAPPVDNAGRGGAEDKEHAMPRTQTTLAVVGIDIGKYSFHVVGLDRRGAIRPAPEVVTRPGLGTLCQHAAVPDRHGGLRRRAPSEPQADGPRP